MSSDTTTRDVCVLSPVSSPVPQAKQHTLTNLTGDPRKVKDLAADFHNLMLKWKSLNSEGMNLVSKIANTKIEKVFHVQDGEYGVQDVKIPSELGPICELLCNVVETLGKVEAKMEHKSKIAEGLESLQRFQKSTVAQSVLFSSMTMHDVAHTLKLIHQEFKQELQLKQELCRQVAHADSQELLMFYCACWMHQPYISSQSHDLLEALLIETGHIKC